MEIHIATIQDLEELTKVEIESKLQSFIGMTLILFRKKTSSG